jgi:hypothetical protein
LPVLTINPRISADDGAFGKLQFLQGLFDTLVLKGVLLDLQDFIVVTVAVHVGAEADIAVDLAGCEIDNSLMEAFL